MSLELYGLTLRPPSAIQCSVLGNFSGFSRVQELVAARGQYLDVFVVDADEGRIKLRHSHNTFANVQTLGTFRVAGATRDHLVVCSDSGRVAVLEFDGTKFVSVGLETFGKSGIRRVVPGRYLATDPKGRAVMLASVERNKLCYVLNRDAENQITVSSPLEAHTARTVVYDLMGVDVGYDNPVFAALEVEYAAEPTKKLTYYELDLGLNHVVRRWTDTVDPTASVLVQVPGGNSGPSGVLVCAQNHISYRHIGQINPLNVVIPRRQGFSEPVVIVSAVTHKTRSTFFFLVQSQLGDLYKVTLEYEDRGKNRVQATQLKIQYFDTIPVAVALNVLKSGYLFTASDSGDHLLCLFEKLGDDDERICLNSDSYSDSVDYQSPEYCFKVEPLENLQLVDRLEATSPLVAARVANLSHNDPPQIYTLSGQADQAQLASLVYGLPVSELISTPLPGRAQAVWTVKTNNSTGETNYDKYIVLSFSRETLVLSIGDTVEEVSDTGILASVATIAIQQLGRDSILQVHRDGLRHILANGTVNEWKPSSETGEDVFITTASTNNYQVALGLSDSRLVYFEIDEENGELNEYNDHPEIPGGIACLSLGDIPPGRARSLFLCIGCANETLRILSLDMETILDPLTVQALTSLPSSVYLMHSESAAILSLHVGLHSGVYIMSIMDSTTGQLSDTRTRFLGPKPVKLLTATVNDGDHTAETTGKLRKVIVALTTRVWVGGFSASGSFELVPLSYPELNSAFSFHSEESPHALIGIEGSNLRLFTVDSIGNSLFSGAATKLRKDAAVPLRYTPRRALYHPTFNLFYIVEASNNTDSKSLQRRTGAWASCIEIVEVQTQSVVGSTDLDPNETAVSLTNWVLDTTQYLVVGTVCDLVVLPKSHSQAYIKVFRYGESGRSLELVHRTPIAHPPLALAELSGRLLAGIGNELVMYDMGQKQLLRKALQELSFFNCIVTLNTMGDRVVVGDTRESVCFVVYKPVPNQLIPFADDHVSRHVTCVVMLDYDTVAVGDRFGNISIVRCPARLSETSDEDQYGTYIQEAARQIQAGSPMGNITAAQRTKLDLVAHYYVQDAPMSLQSTNLIVGGPEVLVYTGIQGTVGVLIPFTSQKEHQLLLGLERLLRERDLSLVGRSHMAFRSYYAPVKSVVDGDLCERFVSLPAGVRDSLSKELGRSPGELERKLMDVRIRSVF